jgi:hypothetical protein
MRIVDTVLFAAPDVMTYFTVALLLPNPGTLVAYAVCMIINYVVWSTIGVAASNFEHLTRRPCGTGKCVGIDAIKHANGMPAKTAQDMCATMAFLWMALRHSYLLIHALLVGIVVAHRFSLKHHTLLQTAVGVAAGTLVGVGIHSAYQYYIKRQKQRQLKKSN